MGTIAHTNPQFSEKRLLKALAACGLAAGAALAASHASAAGPAPRVVTVEVGAPMAMPGAAAESFDGGAVTPRTWVSAQAKAGSGGIPVIQTPYAVISPGALFFNTPLGSYSLMQRITLTNISGYPTGVFPNMFSSTFVYSTDCPSGYPTALADGSSCYFDVQYRPIDLNPDTATLSINCCTSGFSVQLSGQATRPLMPFLETRPSALQFPPTVVGDASEPLFIDVRNTGTNVSDINYSGIGEFEVLEAILRAPDPGDPQSVSKGAKVSSTCYYLYPGETCSIAVVFVPTASGNREGGVLVSTDSSQQGIFIPAYGAGRDSRGVSPLTISEEIRFGDQPVGTTSEPHPFQVQNNTTSEVQITEFTVTGDFEVEKGTCDTIAASSSCSANLVFRPQALGPREGSVTVKTPVDPLPYVGILSGNGVPNPKPLLTLSALQLGFGNGVVGSPSALPVTATNSGELPVNISRIYAVGDYLPSHTCPATLQPGASCTIDVGFSARLKGVRTGTLVIESNALGSPHTVQLKGTGCSSYSASLRGRSLQCSSN